MFKDIVGLIL